MFKETHEAVVNGKKYDIDNIISISSECTNLTNVCAELSQPTYKKDNRGKVVINKAPEEASSPNDADGIMMVMAPKEQAVSAGGWDW